VHINWTHAAVNAAAWLIVARLFAPDLSAATQVLALLVGALAITAGLALLHPWIQWYRGLSGALHALFFAGAGVWTWRAWHRPAARRERWLALVVLAGGWIKVGLEQPSAQVTPYVDWLGANVVPQAHLLGAMAGTIVGLIHISRKPAAE
jgi:rhomboid family GlyGly-CTERM serine protease